MTRIEARPPKVDGSLWRGEAPAKTNLFLRVLEREVSGYHGIESLFQKLALSDEIEIRLREGGGAGEGAGGTMELEGAELRLDVEGMDGEGLGDPRRNLVTRAVEALLARVRLPTPVRIGVRLRKSIPHGAGLGGGSSDAATTLLGLNRLLGEPLAAGHLGRIGVALGSDVPFFLQPGALALGWGRGHRILEVAPLPSRPVLVVVPDFRVSTPEAYTLLAREREGAGGALSDTAHYSPDAFDGWTKVRALAANDFHGPVEAAHPRLREYRRKLEGAGAEIALLSGSGSAVVGIFADREGLEAARDHLAGEEGLRLLVTRSLGPDAHR